MLYVYSHTMCGIIAKVHLSASMKSLVLAFKDLRFLGSYLKAKRPLLCCVSQPIKRSERQKPSFLVWRDMEHASDNSQIVLSVHYVGPHPLLDHLYYLRGFT